MVVSGISGYHPAGKCHGFVSAGIGEGILGGPGRNSCKKKTLSESGSAGWDFSCHNAYLRKAGRTGHEIQQEGRRRVEVTILFKIGAVGILVSVLCQILKHSQREELAFLTSLAGLLLVLFWVLPYINDLFQTIQELFAL